MRNCFSLSLSVLERIIFNKALLSEMSINILDYGLTSCIISFS